MKLNREGLKDRAGWETIGVTVPSYDWEAARQDAEAHPTWVHFGAGNLFRAFPATLQQSLLEQALVTGGVYTAETFDYGIVDKTYNAFDNLSIRVELRPDGSMPKAIIASVAGALRADETYPADYERLKEIFRNPSLQLITFTITEKGYALMDLNGNYYPAAAKDITNGPEHCCTAMGKVAAMLLERFRAGAFPMAVVSLDNCSRNGEKLRASIMTMVDKWLERGAVPQAFADWVRNENNVSFPWTMIDKITPRPAQVVADALTAAGIEDMQITVMPNQSYTAAFVNTERPQYLAIEDRFPNGRPPLEKAGVFMTDRDTVNNVEKMKVMTCLNPLHTALAVYGCLLGYDTIAAEMTDPALKHLVEQIGYVEGLPVVVHPGIIEPQDFIHEVLDERFPNKFMPDTPQRIAMDTSQKVGIRFGETIRSYLERPELDVASLTYIPLAIAGWLRYLLAVDDQGQPMVCSTDPMLDSLQRQLSGVTVGDPASLTDQADAILSNELIFGVDLLAIGLGDRIKADLRAMLEGPGAVRKRLDQSL